MPVGRARSCEVMDADDDEQTRDPARAHGTGRAYLAGGRRRAAAAARGAAATAWRTRSGCSTRSPARLTAPGPPSCPSTPPCRRRESRQLLDAFQPDAVIEPDGEARTRSGSSGGGGGHRGHHRHLGIHRRAQGGGAERGGAHPFRPGVAGPGGRAPRRAVAGLPARVARGRDCRCSSVRWSAGPRRRSPRRRRAAALAASGCAHLSIVPTQLVRLLGEPGGARGACRLLRASSWAAPRRAPPRSMRPARQASRSSRRTG